jgi:type II secretory pathway pseudopilin PulG
MNTAIIKVKTRRKALSLVEIVVSLAIFSFIITIIIGVSITLARLQQRVQAEIFLTQSAQTTLDNISRSLRYGYAYSGGNQTQYTNDHGRILISERLITPPNQNCSLDVNGLQVCTVTGSGSVDYASSSQIVANVIRSPFIVFERQLGNPTSYTDQSAFCSYGGQLYKISNFQIQTNGTVYERFCTDGQEMLPEDVKLEYVYFDVLGQSSENPKNPIVRVKLKVSSEMGGAVELQTTVTQRLIQLL